MKNGKMSWTSITSTVISLIALGLSLTSFYIFNLQPANLEIFPAEEIGLWHFDGTLHLIVPCLLSNKGAQTGTIQNMAVIILDPEKNDEALFLKWDFFRYFNYEANTYPSESKAFPLNISKQSSIFKLINFEGGGDSKNWVPKPITYNMQVIAWSKPSYTPDLSAKFQIAFKPEDVEKIKNNLESGTRTITFAARSEWGKWKSKLLSPVELQEVLNNLQ